MMCMCECDVNVQWYFYVGHSFWEGVLSSTGETSFRACFAPYAIDSQDQT